MVVVVVVVVVNYSSITLFGPNILFQILLTTFPMLLNPPLNADSVPASDEGTLEM
jgi:hypothetical protein